MSSTLILDHQKIQQKITRIAFQIFEDHYDQKEIIIAGIAKNGFVFAQMLSKKLKDISDLDVKLVELKIDKKNPINSEISTELTDADIRNKCIVVVDDVLNSGKTLMYGIKHFLKAPVKNLSVAVLVNRSHKRYPVAADYVGLSLATTLKEHIEVSFEDKKAFSVHLS